MLIVFFHPGKAILPEIAAYQHYFNALGWDVIVAQPDDQIPMHIDVEWHFMGTGGTRRRPGSLLIHEYASASVPPFTSIKDSCKRLFNSTPSIRMFLNEYVRKKISFDDDIPFCYRDMGIDESFLNTQHNATRKDFDFIHCGSIHLLLHFNKLLHAFTKAPLRFNNIIIAGDYPMSERKRWMRYSNIEFAGRLSRDKVLEYMTRSRYGINYRPDREPYVFQTSTKTLEYYACKLPVLSTNSQWLNDFNQQHGGNYYCLRDDLSNLNLQSIKEFQFSFADVSDITWENQIKRSGIEDMIEKALQISRPHHPAR